MRLKWSGGRNLIAQCISTRQNSILPWGLLVYAKYALYECKYGPFRITVTQSLSRKTCVMNSTCTSDFLGGPLRLNLRPLLPPLRRGWRGLRRSTCSPSPSPSHTGIERGERECVCVVKQAKVMQSKQLSTTSNKSTKEELP